MVHMLQYGFDQVYKLRSRHVALYYYTPFYTLHYLSILQVELPKLH